MAAGTLSTPGSKFGPCLDGCDHRDCELTRKMAAVSCSYCEQPIGYETSFYQNGASPSENLCHASCLEDEVDMKRIDQLIEGLRQLLDGKDLQFRQDAFSEIVQVCGEDVSQAYIKNVLLSAVEVLDAESN